MSKILNVYLNSNLVGNLIQDNHGQIFFEYVKEWLEDPKSIPLSYSLPLTSKRFKLNECRGFFSGILPEDIKREIIARNLGISARNDFAMLEKIGGECAGAITFMPHEQALPIPNYKYRYLSEQELYNILQELPTRPLMAGASDVRLSLAGVQDKIAVYVQNGKIALPLNGAPSTHILKPSITRFAGLVFNEAYCMQLAANVGIATANTSIHKIQEIDYLLVERYDRIYKNECIQRLHQEDFCQALAIAPENKYQNEGGPGFSQCIELLRDISTAPVLELQRMLDALIYNFIIGNNDAHGKNFSLLYKENETSLAPLYDIISTVYYPELSLKMAMKIGGEYESLKILPHHFEQLAQGSSLSKPLVKKRVLEMIELISTSLYAVNIRNETTEKIAKLINERCQFIAKRFATKNLPK